MRLVIDIDEDAKPGVTLQGIVIRSVARMVEQGSRRGVTDSVRWYVDEDSQKIDWDISLPRLFDSIADPSAVIEGGASHASPETSRAAAVDPASKLRWTSQRCDLLRAYRSQHERQIFHHGLSDEEAASICGLYQKRAAYWNRCHELRAMELIEDTGKTTTASTGATVMVCRITESGLKALAVAEDEHEAKEAARA